MTATSHRVEIRGCRTRAELEAVVDLLDRAFEDTEREYFERHVLGDSTLDPDDTRILIRDEKLLSSVQIFPRVLRVEDRHVACGGIGNVATDPGARGAGFASMVLREALDRLREGHLQMAMLTTTVNAFYERFGFTTVERQMVTIAGLPGSWMPGLRGFVRDRDLPEVRAIHEEYNARSLGPLVRDDRYWNAQFEFCGEDRDKFLVLEHTGRIRAYVRAAVRKGRLAILEFGASADIPAAFETLILGLASLAPHLPVTMHLSETERNRVGLRTRYTVARDTDLMVSVLDESVRDLVARLMRRNAMTFWLSDFF